MFLAPAEKPLVVPHDVHIQFWGSYLAPEALWSLICWLLVPDFLTLSASVYWTLVFRVTSSNSFPPPDPRATLPLSSTPFPSLLFWMTPNAPLPRCHHIQCCHSAPYVSCPSRHLKVLRACEACGVFPGWGNKRACSIKG